MTLKEIEKPKSERNSLEVQDLTCQWGSVRKPVEPAAFGMGGPGGMGKPGGGFGKPGAGGKPGGKMGAGAGKPGAAAAPAGKTGASGAPAGANGAPVEAEEPFKLLDLNFEVPKGQLVAVVGSVGSGKSSFLQAILGELKTIKGDVRLDGAIAYAAQQVICFLLLLLLCWFVCSLCPILNSHGL